jgi:hypothetical protein
LTESSGPVSVAKICKFNVNTPPYISSERKPTHKLVVAPVAADLVSIADYGSPDTFFASIVVINRNEIFPDTLKDY